MHIYRASYLLCQLFLAGAKLVSYDYHHALQQMLYNRSNRQAQYH
jgi:hypothetical protein